MLSYKLDRTNLRSIRGVSSAKEQLNTIELVIAHFFWTIGQSNHIS